MNKLCCTVGESISIVSNVIKKRVSSGKKKKSSFNMSQDLVGLTARFLIDVILPREIAVCNQSEVNEFRC